MTDMINQAANRKKFLAPILVLLLCGVAMSGAVYAYTASVANVENPVTVEGVAITFKDFTGAEKESAAYDLSMTTGSHKYGAKAYSDNLGWGIKSGAKETDKTKCDAGYYMQVLVGETESFDGTAVALKDSEDEVLVYIVTVVNNSAKAVNVTLKTALAGTYTGSALQGVYTEVYDSTSAKVATDNIIGTKVTADKDVATVAANTTASFTVKVFYSAQSYLYTGSDVASEIAKEKADLKFDIVFTAASATA